MGATKGSVLFICPAFFGYETDIKNAIAANGFDVDFFDERTSNNSVYKAIFRIRKDLLKLAIDKYYRAITDKIKDKRYRFFLLIKGEVIPEWFIDEFKKLNPEARLIYYTYDAFNNNNAHSVYILKHFDHCYSFDFENVNSNPSLKLKHLFYSKDFLTDPTSLRTKKYNMSFVGTLHSNRYSSIKKIADKLEDTFLFFFMPAKWYFFFNKLVKKEYRNISIKEVNFNKISKKQVADIFRASKSVFDIQRSGQTGLTMRTFEVLATGSVLITSNPYIRQADFYDENKIVVLEDLNDDANIEKIRLKIDNTAAFLKPPEATFDKYFVNNWVKEFFESDL